MTSLQMKSKLVTSWSNLLIEQQQEALNFVQSLASMNCQEPRSLKSGLGLCVDLKNSIDTADLDELRNEMWKTFPRDDF